ncbi:hypothetical protein NDU88_001093 [Pleurodeles waltl]|uniref:Uncharacterized protein n=1 Tax=Pleurodeles waltl TaxID=8319 RepID=A0AAV7W023_PLEWA|nr:hypothetical protein NDU88_001093 [Pleurodeles waltl]
MSKSRDAGKKQKEQEDRRLQNEKDTPAEGSKHDMLVGEVWHWSGDLSQGSWLEGLLNGVAQRAPLSRSWGEGEMLDGLGGGKQREAGGKQKGRN